jgi:hypothetical protein
MRLNSNIFLGFLFLVDDIFTYFSFLSYAPFIRFYAGVLMLKGVKFKDYIIINV